MDLESHCASAHHWQRRTLESSHSRILLTTALQRYFGDRIMVSHNFSQPRYLAQLLPGSNSLIFISSQNATVVWIKHYDTYLHQHKLFFQIFLVKISFSEKKIRQVQHTKWDELCPQRKLVFPFQFHFKEIWQVWLWTNFNSTISFV